MDEKKAIRLGKAVREFNVGISTIVEFLNKKGHKVEANPNTKLEADVYSLLIQEYSSDLDAKKKSENFSLKNLRDNKETVSLEDIDKDVQIEDEKELFIKDSSASNKSVNRESEAVVEEPVEEKKKAGLKVIGKVDLESLSGKKKVVKQEDTPEKGSDKKVEEVKPEKKADLPVEEKKAEPVAETIKEEKAEPETPKSGVKVVGTVDLSLLEKKKSKPKATEEISKEKVVAETETKKTEETEEAAIPVKEETKPVETKKPEEMIPTVFEKLSGPTVVGRIVLPEKRVPEKTQKPVASSSDTDKSKKKRRRISKDTEKVDLRGDKNRPAPQRPAPAGGTALGKRKKRLHRPEVNEDDVQKQIKDTLAKLTSKSSKSKGSKYRREKRDVAYQKVQADLEQKEVDKSTIKVTEFVSVSELASLISTPVNLVIQTCMDLGLFVSINQRLDAETLAMVADEFNYKVEFVSVELQESIDEEDDHEVGELIPRPPIVTVMGHVDHGKTKLLDHIRSANVIAGEAGGITQHIGAYSVELNDGRKITFLDTPGHEAFTAMRARGAQITDIVIIVVAADDGVKPQTIEAINHAAAANVPIIFAINKIDKPSANPDKVKEELANMNYLVEEWGGKFQSQDISAKNGLYIDELLEKVLLEAELLELTANPDRYAKGSVIESSLDKGRGFVTTILVESGTLRIGDVVLAGSHFGHVKAMFNERGLKIKEAGPATPILILGLNGAPQAGDRFNVMENDRIAKDYASRREQLQREQDLRTQKHITLDEIGRRIAIGNFKELNVIVKGDVDGSIEALSDSLLKLSTEEIQVNIKHKAVGQISESDILLAAASDAVIIGFQVRPSLSARKLAEKEQIDIRLYSIIYDAIEEIRAAMEGMLSPEIREEIVATLEIIETFKITKTGTIAGCMVREGKIKRDSKIRIIREGIVVFSGELGSLKRFKDDAKEVASGLECGLNIKNFNDIKVGDVIEAYSETEIRKKL
ncbi:MAG: translation initiation factor IF-2 [Bacteroidales bacterium]|nr:translation initiation factor IF-2 [Bacteroidales bacterium]MCF8390651.1 translation initiation factor IF-2 [Bacteroidales bacterium]